MSQRVEKNSRKNARFWYGDAVSFEVFAYMVFGRRKKKSKHCNNKTMLTFEMEGFHHNDLMLCCLVCSFRKSGGRAAL